MLFIQLISLMLLIFIAVTDFMTRQIPVVLLIAESVCSLVIGYFIIDNLLSKALAINLLIVGFQILSLWIWLKLKENESVHILWSRFGKGDLFMLAIAAINFSPMNYLLFIILICILSLIIKAGYSIFQRSSINTIPFAGYLASGLFVCRIFQISGKGIFFYSNTILTNLNHGIH
jgi:hypothetical protein